MGHLDPHSLHPLPPPRTAVETVPILRQTARASRAIAELKGIAQTIPSQQMLVNAVILKEAKDSSEIENIITSTDELYEALTARDVKLTSDTKEVINYRSAIMLGTKILREQGFIRVNDILRIQKDLLMNDAGLRSTPGTVLKNDQTGEVVYTPPQDYQDIVNLMSNFIRFYNDDRYHGDISPLIWLGILHYQFESIHPFYDGNGRTGRILNILFLILNDYLDISILYLSAYIIKHKADYYRLLNGVNRRAEWEPWILFMLRAVEETSQSTILQIQAIRAELKRAITEIKDKAPKTYTKELVELIFEQPYTKTDYVVNKLGIVRKTAARYLRTLESIGILTSKKVSREVIYINVGLLKILRETDHQ